MMYTLKLCCDNWFWIAVTESMILFSHLKTTDKTIR